MMVVNVNQPVDRGRMAVRVFERLWQRRGSDLCDLLAPPAGVGEFRSQSLVEPAVIATDIPIVYDQAGESTQIILGGVTYQASHTIQLVATADTLAITPAYQIRLHARDANPELIFEQPVRTQRPFNPVLTIAAIVASQEFSRSVVDKPWQRIVRS